MTDNVNLVQVRCRLVIPFNFFNLLLFHHSRSRSICFVSITSQLTDKLRCHTNTLNAISSPGYPCRTPGDHLWSSRGPAVIPTIPKIPAAPRAIRLVESVIKLSKGAELVGSNRFPRVAAVVEESGAARVANCHSSHHDDGHLSAAARSLFVCLATAAAWRIVNVGACVCVYRVCREILTDCLTAEILRNSLSSWNIILSCPVLSSVSGCRPYFSYRPSSRCVLLL